MQKYVIMITGLLLIFACRKNESNAVSFAELRGNIPLEITIFADSTHSMHLQTTVKKGTSLQKVMQATVQVGYGGSAQKFVTSLIGVKADSRKRQFWFLEIDNQASQVGLAQIMIENKMQVRWRLKNY